MARQGLGIEMTSRWDAEMLSGHSVGGTVQVVIDTLFQKIKSQDYPVDSRLPSERSLAAELVVSRNTVREALEVLETKKIIRRRAGSGSFVIFRTKATDDGDRGSVAERTSPLDHLIVRSIIDA